MITLYEKYKSETVKCRRGKVMKYIVYAMLLLSIMVYEKRDWIVEQWIVYTAVNVDDYLNYPRWFDDDTTGIQNAINAVDKQSWWQFKGVYLPASQYKISRNLDLPPNVILRGR